MKTIIIGFPDREGKGESVQIASASVPIADQFKQVAAIRAGAYPAGILRVEHWSDEKGVLSRAIAHPSFVHEEPKKKKA